MSRNTLAAGAVALAALTAAPATAQITFDWGDGDFKINVWPACLYDKPDANRATIRANARAAGYRRIHNITLNKRRFNRAARCGFYRAEAYQSGREYALYFNADSGELISARKIGDAVRDRRLNEAQIRRRLARQGWSRIRNLRFIDRGRNEFYVARARKGRAVYRVWADAQTGKVERTKQLKKLRATKAEVRAELRARGYRRIRNLRVRDRRGDEYWIARATKRGTTYRILADIETGKPVRRVALEKEHISPREARMTMRRAGFRRIDNLRKVERRGNVYFIARASRQGNTYRVFVDAEDGDIVRTRRVR